MGPVHLRSNVSEHLTPGFTECVELVDDYSKFISYIDAAQLKTSCFPAISAINKAGTVDRTYPARDSLFFKIQGSNDSIKATAKVIQAIIKRHSGANFQYAATDDEAASLWEARKYALMSVLASEEGVRAWTTDVWYEAGLFKTENNEIKALFSVPVSKLPQLVQETKQDLAASGLKAGILGHVGDGLFITYRDIYIT